MDNSPFMQHFNNILKDERKLLKLGTAVLNADNQLVITFVIDADDYDKYLDNELRKRVEDAVLKLIPSSFKTHIVYRKSSLDRGYISRLVMEFLYNEIPLIFSKIKEESLTVEIEYELVKVKLALTPNTYSFMKSGGYEERIAAHLDTKLTGEIAVAFFVEGKDDDTIIYRRKKADLGQSIKVIDVEVTENIVGAVTKMPRYISDVLKGTSNRQTVCGKVLLFQKRIANKTQKPYFTFKINDTTGILDAVYFPRGESAANLFEEKVKDGVQIAAEGPVQINQYSSNNLNIRVMGAGLCSIDYTSIVTTVVYKEAPDEYTYVEPQPYREEEQTNIFGDELAYKEQLKGTYVVFDLETTGLSASTDKIIEIGAVKIQDGIIIETFSTLINPEREIPADASRVNNIYDSDVRGAPYFEDVVGDFYKFTRGAALVAHNAPFDMGFLSYHSKAVNYNFDNDIIDTLQLARSKLRTKKSHSLDSLCKEFDIPLVQAHRALYDATATAKVFKKLVALD
ncbi:MAG: 3'-5' exonuclease [Clostridia bacterium]